MLEYTSAHFVSNTLTKFASYLGLSEALAGCTLIAFANSATEIGTMMVNSLEPKDEGDDMVLGDLMGASMFMMLPVFGYIVLKSKNKHIKNVSVLIKIIL